MALNFSFKREFSPLLYMLLLLLGGCTYTIKIKDGATAYERKQYHTAYNFLVTDYSKAKTKSERGKIAFLLGDCLVKTGDYTKATDWFKRAYDNGYGPEALRAYAQALKRVEMYPEAAKTFKDLGIEIGSPYEFRRDIAACDTAIAWLASAPETGFAVLKTNFNSPKNDFSPLIFSDGRILFTSDRKTSTGEDTYQWTGNNFMDLFIVAADGASAQAFDPLLNSATHESTPCFSADFSEMYFVRVSATDKYSDGYCRIFYAQKTGDSWSEPKMLPFQKDRVNYMHPALSRDGSRLYFSSNDPDNWGGYDLAVTTRKPGIEATWSEPRSLSRNINTAGNEVFPVFEGDTLYFASDGLPGMGGLDVFKTYSVSENAWATPQNLKSPINSGADDFGLVSFKRYPSNAGNAGELLWEGYFASNRNGTTGGDDIWKFEQRIVKRPPPPVKDTTPPAPIVYKILLDGFVLEKIHSITDNPNSSVLGRKPLDAAKVLVRWGAGKEKIITVGADGRFELELEEQTEYQFLASKDNYLSKTERFSTVGFVRDPSRPIQRYEVEVVLDKIYRDREIVLENIYYDFDRSEIRPDAEPALNRLANTLQQNPDIRIQLGSHTDCRGSDTYNRDLSQLRAQSAVDYLIRRGIASERLSAVGYGEAQPVADCVCQRCTESDHQANRRTTFRIL